MGLLVGDPGSAVSEASGKRGLLPVEGPRSAVSKVGTEKRSSARIAVLSDRFIFFKTCM